MPVPAVLRLPLLYPGLIRCPLLINAPPRVGELAFSEAAAERRLLKGLGNIIRALRLPRGTSPRTVAGWVRSLGMPAFRMLDGGPYYADPDQLSAWWTKVQSCGLR